MAFFIAKGHVKFVAISDTHCRHRNLRLPKGDVLLHAGDISHRGKKEEVVDFLEWFSGLPFAHKIFIAGNHDFYFETQKPAAIQTLLPAGITYLNDSGVTLDGITVWGSPVTPWFFNWAFNRQRGAAINKHWKKMPEGTDVLLTHGPPFGIHDAVVNSRQVGCKDLLRRIGEVKPTVHVCGHIHEGYGSLKREGIRYINASVLNESYELVNKPVVFEIGK